MADLIDRQTAIETAIEAADKWDGGYSSEREGIIRKFFDKVPAVQPDHNADISKKVEKEDCISRQAAVDAIMGQPPEPHYPSWYAAQIEKLPAVQPATNCSEIPNGSDDTISRRAAIDAVDSETVSTNPEHFKSSEKFIKFMKDADIASFGKWQWANGFNTALVATTIRLKALPSVQPEKE